jgi:hypothetical protein
MVWWEWDEKESFRRIVEGYGSYHDFVCAYRICSEDVDKLVELFGGWENESSFKGSL